MTRFAILVTALLASGPAGADGEVDRLVTEADRARLAGFDAVRQAARAEARAAGGPEFDAVDAILEAEALSFSDFDMIGEWRCRTIKLGGLQPLVVYGWFRCRVTDDGSGWQLEKLTGSQRTKGRFYTASDSRLTYLGGFYVAGDPVPSYGAGPDSDQIGYATRIGEDALRIEFPLPRYESKFDVLELRR